MMKSSAAPRSLSGGIVVVLLGLLAFQAGLRIMPSLMQQDQEALATSGVREMLEQAQVLDDEPNDLKALLLPAAEIGEEAEVVNTCPFNGGNKTAFAELFAGLQELRAEAHEAYLEAQSNMSWMSDFPGSQQAHAQHKKTMQDLESRKQARLQARLEKRASAQTTQDGSTQHIEAGEEMRLEAESNMSWEQDFPGALQARVQHIKTMEEIEARKHARLQARIQKRGFAQAIQDHQIDGNGWQNLLDAHAEAEANMSWLQDFPGAKQARAEHAKRMQELELRKQARSQARRELRALGQSTHDGFTEYFKARKQAQAQRRNKRDLRAFAQTTQDGFTEYFKARKAAQSQRRKERQPSSTIAQKEQKKEFRRQRRSKMPKEDAWTEVVNQLEHLESPAGGHSASQAQDMKPAELTDFVQGLVDLLAY
jgi:hypothetical protein